MTMVHQRYVSTHQELKLAVGWKNQQIVAGCVSMLSKHASGRIFNFHLKALVWR